MSFVSFYNNIALFIYSVALIKIVNDLNLILLELNVFHMISSGPYYQLKY